MPAITSKSDKIARVTGKVRAAIDAMVWEGLPRAEAAKAADLSEHGLYKAMRKPPVKAYYLSECEVLRTSGRARRIHRLEEMLEQNDNKAAVINAALALDRMPDEVANRGSQALPGLQIVIVQGQSLERQPAISTSYVENGTDDV